MYDEQGTLNVGMDPEIGARLCNFIGLATTLIYPLHSVIILPPERLGVYGS